MAAAAVCDGSAGPRLADDWAQQLPPAAGACLEMRAVRLPSTDSLDEAAHGAQQQQQLLLLQQQQHQHHSPALLPSSPLIHRRLAHVSDAFVDPFSDASRPKRHRSTPRPALLRLPDELIGIVCCFSTLRDVSIVASTSRRLNSCSAHALLSHPSLASCPPETAFRALSGVTCAWPLRTLLSYTTRLVAEWKKQRGAGTSQVVTKPFPELFADPSVLCREPRALAVRQQADAVDGPAALLDSQALWHRQHVTSVVSTVFLSAMNESAHALSKALEADAAERIKDLLVGDLARYRTFAYVLTNLFFATMKSETQLTMLATAAAMPSEMPSRQFCSLVSRALEMATSAVLIGPTFVSCQASEIVSFALSDLRVALLRLIEFLAQVDNKELCIKVR
ncbi:hypothetical protein DIPPA_30355, partial [Diplonema papillatum]